MLALRAAVCRGLAVMLLLALWSCGGSGPSFDPDASTITVDKSSAVADGVDAIVVTVHVVDGQGQPVHGCAVEVEVSGAANQITPGSPTDSSGNTNAMISSRIAEAKTVSAVVTCGTGSSSPLNGSQQVEFTPGPAMQLVFLVQPQSTDAGVPFAPAIQVAAEDTFGNIATEVTGTITVALAPNPKQTTVSGTTSVALVAGVAMFGDLNVRVPDQGYQLVASSTLISSSTTSYPFDISYGAPSSMSTLTLTPGSVAADGVTPITAVVTIVNDGGVGIPGQSVAVQMAGTGGDVFPRTGTTDDSGQFSTSLTSRLVATDQVTATSGSLVLTAMASFTAPPCTLLLPGLPAIPQGTSLSDVFAADFDGDGHPDVAVLHGGDLAIFRGVGDGRLHLPYQYPTTAGQVALAGGDLDHDGDIDLVAATATSAVVLLNQGDGQFQKRPAIALPGPLKGLVLADLDQNGTIDLVERTDQSVVTALGLGDGTFSTPVVYPLGFTQSISGATLLTTDANGDTHPDVVTIGTNNQLSVLLANSDGTLQDPLTSPVGFYFGGQIDSGDLDGDGKPDLVFPSPDGLYIKHGNGDGTFTSESSIEYFQTMGALVADLTGDGHPDVVASASASGSEVRLYVNNGDGTFQAPQVYGLVAFGQALAAADFDSDGRLDVVVGQQTLPSQGGFVSVFPGTSSAGLLDSSFQGDVTGPSRSWFVGTTGDFNNDGILDFVAEGTALDVGWLVWLAAADGTLTQEPGIAMNGSWTAAGDLDADGKLDLLIGYGGNVSWLRGNGDGTLQNPVTTAVTSADRITVADVNHDGKLDVIGTTGAGTGTVSVALGNGNGTFATPSTYPVGATPRSPITVDLDHDGNLDLVIPNEDAGSVSILKGVGDGTFVAAPTVTVGGQPISLTSGDFDGDGNIDLAVNNVLTKQITVLHGAGDTTFPVATLLDAGFTTYWIATTDLDGDGVLDLVAFAQGALVFRGIGDGTFRAPQLYPTAIGAFDGALADFNRDGRVDVFAASAVAGDFQRVGYAMLHNMGCK